MSELKEIGGFIVSADPFVQHDTSLSGNGTVSSPLGTDLHTDTSLSGNGTTNSPFGVASIPSNSIVVTNETIGTFGIRTSTNIEKTFSKTGYKPLVWTITYTDSRINFFQINSEINSNNSVTLRGVATNNATSTTINTTFKAYILWIKV